MNGDDIALFINFLHIQYMLYIPAQIPGRIHRHIRIITIHFHSQMFGHICHLDTDSPQADDTKLLTLNLGTCKVFLGLLRIFRDILIGHIFLHPFNTSRYITGCQQHTCYHKFFHTIRISTRCIKNHNTFLGTLIQWNIIDARSCTRNGNQTLRQFHIMHRRTSDQDAIGLRHILRLHIQITEFLQTHTRNRI